MQRTKYSPTTARIRSALPFSLAVCSQICASPCPALPKAASSCETHLSLQGLSLTRETRNGRFSGTLIVVVKAQEGVSKPALPGSLQFWSGGCIQCVGVLGRMTAYPKNEGKKCKKKATPTKLPLLAFSLPSCRVCGNGSLDPVLVIAVPWDRRFHFPSRFPGWGKTNARSPSHASRPAGSAALSEYWASPSCFLVLLSL